MLNSPIPKAWSRSRRPRNRIDGQPCNAGTVGRARWVAIASWAWAYLMGLEYRYGLRSSRRRVPRVGVVTQIAGTLTQDADHEFSGTTARPPRMRSGSVFSRPPSSTDVSTDVSPWDPSCQVYPHPFHPQNNTELGVAAVVMIAGPLRGRLDPYHILAAIARPYFPVWTDGCPGTPAGLHTLARCMLLLFVRPTGSPL